MASVPAGVVFGESEEAPARLAASSKKIKLKQTLINREPIKKKVLFAHLSIGLAHISGKMRWALLGPLDLVVHHQPIPEPDEAAGVVHDHLIVS